MQPIQLPEWIQYISGAMILVITGVATRLGFSSMKQAPPASVAGEADSHDVIALDQKTLKAMAEILDTLTQSLEDMHRDRLRCNKESREELAELRSDIRTLARQLERAVEHLKT